jgi:hypothetical protein
MGLSGTTQSTTMSDHTTTQAIEATLAAAGSKATYTGAGMTIGGWVVSSELAVLVGMMVGVCGLLVQWYYRHKLTNAEIEVLRERNERDRAAHELRMTEIRKDLAK